MPCSPNERVQPVAERLRPVVPVSHLVPPAMRLKTPGGRGRDRALAAHGGTFAANAAGWKVVGNHLYGVKQHAIYAHRCWGTTIADNYIEGLGEGGGDEIGRAH